MISRVRASGIEAISAAGATGKTAWGVPAAHQTRSNRSSDSSTIVRTGAIVADGRHTADRVAGRLAHLVAVCLPDAATELRGVHAAVSGAEAEHGPLVIDEDERLDDLPDLDADGRRRLLRGPRGLRELLDLGVEAEVA